MAWNFTPATPPTVMAVNSLLNDDFSVITWVGWNGARFPMAGGVAPVPGAQNGVYLTSVKGVMAPVKHLTKQGARQDGDDWVDALWDAMEIELDIDITGTDPASFRRSARGWLNSWDTKRTGRLSWWTSQSGEWWTDCRLGKEVSDPLKNAPAMMNHLPLNWIARSDSGLWQSFDSTSEQMATDATTLADPNNITPAGFLPQWNRGDQDGWPRYLVQGPGTFTIGNNGGVGSVTFGPLTLGQQALITTLPNRRSITDLQTGVNLYSKLSGRFSTSVAPGAAVHVPVSVTGAQAGVTSIQAALTPYRKWPE
ncbi:hypothetical protein ACFYU5_19140 [Nocardia aobensis]|uniref:Phage tail protein n=1 Tax=Nocardia aobensis TaxID=257277 RepID=A0ABW6P5V0_9NOCA